MSSHTSTPARPEEHASIFISYARSDGKDLAVRLYKCLTEKHPWNVWLDEIDIDGGNVGWWSQIESAISNAKYLVLVLTPGAEQSKNVLKEWRYARERGVCVLPVIADLARDNDSSNWLDKFPRWIKKHELFDLRNPERQIRFIRNLESPCRRPTVKFVTGGAKPIDFVERPNEFEKLLNVLLDSSRQEPIAITAGLSSSGGYGKTVLASALCEHDDVKNAFGDGILWVELGEDVTEQKVVEQIQNLIEQLTGVRPELTSIESLTAELDQRLADHDILLVIDDVWHETDIRPFLRVGRNCARLITTRHAGLLSSVLSSQDRKIDVDAMLKEESIRLLGSRLEGAEQCTDGLTVLADRLGRWPQLLNMVNAVLRENLRDGQPLDNALADVNVALNEAGLGAFDQQEEGRYRAVGVTLNLSFTQLDQPERVRFNDLAIFRENTNIPIATAQRLWHTADGSYTIIKAKNFCGKLFDLSLIRNRNLAPSLNQQATTGISSDETQSGTIELQDVIQTYLRHINHKELVAYHHRLLEAYRSSSEADSDDGFRWSELQEGYLWNHLAYHLEGADQKEQLLRTIKEWCYLVKKIRLQDAAAINSDIEVARRMAPEDDLLPKLFRALSDTELVFSGLNHSEKESALFNRVVHLKGSLREMPEAPNLVLPHIRLRFDFPDLLNERQFDPVEAASAQADNNTTSCCFSPVRNWVVSTSQQNGLQFWNPENGKVIPQPFGNFPGEARSCTVSPDGNLIVCASGAALKIWDTTSNQFVRILDQHTDDINACAFSSDGGRLVSASSDKTLRVWDTLSREPIKELKRDADGEMNEVLGIWQETNIRVDGHEQKVNACAFSPDGRKVVSASDDNSLKIWDLESGQVIHSLDDHSGEVNACTFSHDGRFIVSASSDKDLRIWSTETGRTIQVFPGTGDSGERLEGHTDAVNACVFSDNDKLIVSASADGFVRVWDVDSGECQARFYDKGTMRCCLIQDHSIIAGGTRGVYFLSLELYAG